MQSSPRSVVNSANLYTTMALRSMVYLSMFSSIYVSVYRAVMRVCGRVCVCYQCADTEQRPSGTRFYHGSVSPASP